MVQYQRVLKSECIAKCRMCGEYLHVVEYVYEVEIDGKKKTQRFRQLRCPACDKVYSK